MTSSKQRSTKTCRGGRAREEEKSVGNRVLDVAERKVQVAGTADAEACWSCEKTRLACRGQKWRSTTTTHVRNAHRDPLDPRFFFERDASRSMATARVKIEITHDFLLGGRETQRIDQIDADNRAAYVKRSFSGDFIQSHRPAFLVATGRATGETTATARSCQGSGAEKSPLHFLARSIVQEGDAQKVSKSTSYTETTGLQSSVVLQSCYSHGISLSARTTNAFTSLEASEPTQHDPPSPAPPPPH